MTEYITMHLELHNVFFAADYQGRLFGTDGDATCDPLRLEWHKECQWSRLGCSHHMRHSWVASKLSDEYLGINCLIKMVKGLM